MAADVSIPVGEDPPPRDHNRLVMHVSIGAIATFAAQTIGFVALIVQMRGDITQLRVDHTALEARLSAIDNGGTRELALIRQRQIDLIASQTAQDARISELYVRTGKSEQQANENKFWIDQLREMVKTLTHPPPRP